MPQDDAELSEITHTLLMAMLPEIARHHPGILERIELRLTNRIDTAPDLPAARHAIEARDRVRRLIR